MANKIKKALQFFITELPISPLQLDNYFKSITNYEIYNTYFD